MLRTRGWAVQHADLASRSEKAAKPVEFIIDETFGVPGVGTVVAGTLKQGVIATNSNLLLGPSPIDGGFTKTAIKSIHYKRLAVPKVHLRLPVQCCTSHFSTPCMEGQKPEDMHRAHYWKLTAVFLCKGRGGSDSGSCFEEGETKFGEKGNGVGWGSLSTRSYLGI